MANIESKQQLERRNTYTPTDTPQVCGNCNSSLNREETLSVPDLKTLSNKPDVDLPQPAWGLKTVMQVFILNRDGKPLMPCKPAKAKHLLKEHKAKIVQHSPFTIQPLWQCESDTQDVTLGIDSGYQHIGFSAVTDKREFLSGEVTARTDIPKLKFMNAVRWKLTELTGADYTFGYITKRNRILYSIDKSHANDAFVIAGGSKQVRSSIYNVYQRRRNNRTLQINRKGFKPSKSRKRYSMQPGDTAEYNNSIWNVSGIRNYGKEVIIRYGDKKMDVNINKVKMVRYGKGLQFQSRFLHNLMDGVSSGVVK